MTRAPVLILGAMSDLGVAIGHRFARAGHGLHLAARDPDRLAPVCSDLAIRHRVPVTPHAYDATDPAAITALLPALDPAPEVVISVVGWMGDQPRTEAEADLAWRTVATNFTGPLWSLVRAAAFLDQTGRPGAVIGIGSVAGERGRAKNYWYGASKSGFHQGLSGLRQRYARTRVRVITVKPGYIRTGMIEGAKTPALITATPEAWADRIYRAHTRGHRVVWDPKWWLIMTVVKLIPERIFERLKF